MATKKKPQNASILIANRPRLESAEDISELAGLRKSTNNAMVALDVLLEEEITMESENVKTQKNVLEAAKTFVNEKNRLIFFAMVFGLVAFTLYLIGQGKIPLPTVSW